MNKQSVLEEYFKEIQRDVDDEEKWHPCYYKEKKHPFLSKELEMEINELCNSFLRKRKSQIKIREILITEGIVSEDMIFYLLFDIKDKALREKFVSYCVEFERVRHDPEKQWDWKKIDKNYFDGLIRRAKVVYLEKLNGFFVENTPGWDSEITNRKALLMILLSVDEALKRLEFGQLYGGLFDEDLTDDEKIKEVARKKKREEIKKQMKKLKTKAKKVGLEIC